MNIVIKAIRNAASILFYVFALALWFFGIPVVLMPMMIHNYSLLEHIYFILIVCWVLFSVSLAMDHRAADKMMKIMTKIEGEN